jgi:hypothetical protein
MADTDATAAAHILKLFVDTRARRVLFAEASRDAVGFFHSLLSHLYSLPLDDATRHGCTANIYDSFDALDAGTCSCHRRLRLGCCQQQQPDAAERFFVCGDNRGAGCGEYVTDRSGATCPSCGGRMEAEVPRGAPGAGGSGGQQGAAPAMACMLRDDLTVVPTSGTLLALTGNVMRGVFTAIQVATVRLGHNEVSAPNAIAAASFHVNLLLVLFFLLVLESRPRTKFQLSDRFVT